MDIDLLHFNSEIISLNPPQVRLWIHRTKKFLLEVAKSFNIPTSILYDAINDSVQMVLNFIPRKIDLGASLYDLALAAFWDRLTSYGIMEISIHKLIKIAKIKLKHKVTHGKVLRVLAFLKESRNDIMNFNERVQFYVKQIVNRYFEQRNLKLESQGINTAKVRDNLISIVLRILDRLFEVGEVEGSPKVLAGAILYLTSRLCRKVMPITMSSSVIESLTGINRFTILRRYKQILSVLAKGIFINEVCSLE
ncbi:MAG: cyclin domain-containing protein [Crenarchaeota archaeon]|nr:cyclin domain-containing protein [Thermoproteota archaeon]MCR8454293.1 cyclin domain-containing protein [Thermoproteota archaeon]MCR8455061.1 cyclin domain-containing protein [Thermoproteota archaeon]MCR8463354.1 cyclin domain-containing protein [Thermoproteota archaeon]MCR8470801.1 cyclin domain-containing protein [Thermoproteota archaeon]